jgi:hypothetical protein
MTSSIIETPLINPWKGRLIHGLSLACGLALAVASFGGPAWTDSPAASSTSPRPEGAQVRAYTPSERALLYLVDSREEQLAIETALNERTEIGSTPVSILLLETEADRQAFQLEALEAQLAGVFPDVIDLTGQE